MSRARWALAAGVLAVVALTSCDGAGTAGAQRAAELFYASLARQDGSAACLAMAPDTALELQRSNGAPCPEAILEEQLRQPGAVTHAVVYGSEGMVRFEDDTVFVAEFSGSWLVVAAGCTARADRPYQCELQGG